MKHHIGGLVRPEVEPRGRLQVMTIMDAIILLLWIVMGVECVRELREKRWWPATISGLLFALLSFMVVPFILSKI